MAMGKPLRILIAIVVILSLVLLARNEVAWAANPYSSQNLNLSVSPEQHARCDKEKDKYNKHKCDDDDDGTVKPPKDDIKVCEKGSYSVGGAAIMEVRNLRKRDCLNANTRPSDPAVDKLPLGAGMIVSDVLNVMMTSRYTTVKVCFAVPPGPQV
jgi:hypothetical protein